MKLLRDEEVEKICKYGREIGEGSTRRVVLYKGRVFKVAFCGCNIENKKEVELYLALKEQYKFLNEIYGHSEDYRVIEVEFLECDEIDESVQELEVDNLYVPVYMEEFIDLKPWIRETLDFDFNLITEFIEMNNLDPMEILLPTQWGINKDGKLRISDYSR